MKALNTMMSVPLQQAKQSTSSPTPTWQQQLEDSPLTIPESGSWVTPLHTSSPPAASVSGGYLLLQLAISSSVRGAPFCDSTSHAPTKVAAAPAPGRDTSFQHTVLHSQAKCFILSVTLHLCGCVGWMLDHFAFDPSPSITSLKSKLDVAAKGIAERPPLCFPFSALLPLITIMLPGRVPFSFAAVLAPHVECCWTSFFFGHHPLLMDTVGRPAAGRVKVFSLPQLDAACCFFKPCWTSSGCSSSFPQTVQIPDNDIAINIGDENQSHVLTAPPTFTSSYVPTLAPEETDKYFEDQARISNTFEKGRPPSSSSTTLPTFREVEVNIPKFDYAVDEYAFHDYAVDGYVIDDYIVDENAFNFPFLHD
ncbi:hypothetical protein LR48_Vigan07g131100 [Vigna angularis]|uniref:Uncharacterized protein n=1 Tax=Phaseolus angularis TaxID=3914 RepID=A0A0L9UYF0_PHAAN|nr:hypothetical protein LR48_Vigan07g131100 [Vigna angularis]